MNRFFVNNAIPPNKNVQKLVVLNEWTLNQLILENDDDDELLDRLSKNDIEIEFSETTKY